jgi:hypothetical protein
MESAMKPEPTATEAAAMITANEAKSWRASEDTDGPNDSGYYTTGIDAPMADIFGQLDWHIHAIQFHDKDKATAEERRNLVLRAIKELEK